MSNAIAEGDLVPEFALPATAGKTVASSALKGKFIVLYFYPKDNTPGCTQEGQAFRDLHGEFERHGAEIFGISRDSVKCHEGFKGKHDFPFELISDADESLCQTFDVIKMKNMYGKQVRGIERSTFLIDREGRLARAWRKVRVAGHAQEVLDTLKSLSSA